MNPSREDRCSGRRGSWCPVLPEVGNPRSDSMQLGRGVPDGSRVQLLTDWIGHRQGFPASRLTPGTPIDNARLPGVRQVGPRPNDRASERSEDKC
jgi:hypothetical protein